MKTKKKTRANIVSQQIEAALELRGFNRKQFAELMHRKPSEVTKWLSGEHNFTIALLQEISDVLGVEISGVENISALVDGYSPARDAASLQDCLAIGDLAATIRWRSAEIGISLGEYLRQLVDDDLRRSKVLPKINLDAEPSEITKKYSGIVKCHEISSDERFERIWNR